MKQQQPKLRNYTHKKTNGNADKTLLQGYKNAHWIRQWCCGVLLALMILVELEKSAYVV